MAVRRAGCVTRNLTPISYVQGPEPPRPSRVSRFTCCGVRLVENSWHGQDDVLKLHVTAAGSAVPRVLRMPVVSRAVYVVFAASAALGCRDAVRVALS